MKSYDSYVLFAALVFLLPALPFALIAWFNASRAASVAGLPLAIHFHQAVSVTGRPVLLSFRDR